MFHVLLAFGFPQVEALSEGITQLDFAMTPHIYKKKKKNSVLQSQGFETTAFQGSASVKNNKFC